MLRWLSPYVCGTEATSDNCTNQEHHQDDAAQYFDSNDDDVILEIPVHNNEDNALVRESENCILWIKQPVH